MSTCGLSELAHHQCHVYLSWPTISAMCTWSLPKLAHPDLKVLELSGGPHHVPLIRQEHGEIQRNGRVTAVQGHGLKVNAGLVSKKVERMGSGPLKHVNQRVTPTNQWEEQGYRLHGYGGSRPTQHGKTGPKPTTY